MLARRLPRPDPNPVLGAVDGGARVFQRRARTLILGSAVFVVPVLLLNLLATTLAYDRFADLDDAFANVPELGGGADAIGAEALIWFLGIYLGGLAVALAGGVAAEVVVRHRLGDTVSTPAALGAVARRLPALVIAWLIGHVWMVLVAALAVGVDRGAYYTTVVLLSPLIVGMTVMTAYVSPVIVVERAGPILALRRSWRLAKARFGNTLWMISLSMLVGLWVRFGITWLPRLAEWSGLITLGRFGWLVEGVAGQLAVLLAVPLVAAATAWAYLEARLSAEGLDLAMEAAAVFPDAARRGEADG